MCECDALRVIWVEEFLPCVAWWRRLGVDEIVLAGILSISFVLFLVNGKRGGYFPIGMFR